LSLYNTGFSVHVDEQGGVFVAGQTFGYIGTEPGGQSFGGADAFLTKLVEQTFLLGDVNLDGVVSLLDIGPFTDLLISGGYQAEADINQDGILNLLDIGLLIDLILGS